MLAHDNFEPQIVVALQVLTFRHEWRSLYDLILSDSLLFKETLIRYRGGEHSALVDISPDLSALAADLSMYLHSECVEALVGSSPLAPYLWSLNSTVTGAPWISDAFRSLGELRRELRRVGKLGLPKDSDRQKLTGTASECLPKLRENMGPYLTPGVHSM